MNSLAAQDARIRRTATWALSLFVAIGVITVSIPPIAGLAARYWPVAVACTLGYVAAVFWGHHQIQRIYELEERLIKVEAMVRMLAAAHVDDALHDAVIDELWKSTVNRDVTEEAPRIAKGLHWWMFPP